MQPILETDAARAERWRPWAIAAIAIGLGTRLWLAFTTIGTSDVLFNLYFANIVQKYGVIDAYRFGEFINHPPLSLLLIGWYSSAATAAGIEFPHVYRLVQSLADCVTAFAVWKLGYGVRSRWAALAFLLSPAAIFVSGFHCNTDPTLLAFLMLAVLAARRERYTLSGCLLALAFGIKIVALFAAPLLFFAAGRRRWHLLGGFAFVASLIYLPAAIGGGKSMLVNVFGYAGWAGGWGLPGIARRMHDFAASGSEPTGWLVFSELYFRSGKYLLAAVLVLFYVAFHRWLRTREPIDLLVESIPVVYLIVLSVAPAFGMQYLVWPLPLLPFVLTRGQYLVTSALFSLYLFAVYTIWSGGFPWWFADATRPDPAKLFLTDAGFLIWAWVVVATLLALRHTRGAVKYARDSSLSNAQSA